MSQIATERLDANRIRISSRNKLDIVLFANDQVPIDRASLQEIETIVGIADTISELNGEQFFGDQASHVHRAVLTPDFHKGAGIPIGTVLDVEGFVLPKCAGSDIGCGMRLIVTDLRRDDFDRMTNLDTILRYRFFEGGREIPLNEHNRAAMLREGVLGLTAMSGGLWNWIDRNQMHADLDRTHRLGHWPTRDLWNFADYVRGSGGTSYDSAIASIGGGNHFVELQIVEECLDRKTCWEWGLKAGYLTIMVHTGSVGLGSQVGDHFVDVARKLYPSRLPIPTHDYLPLPTVGPHHDSGESYLSAMGLAANFANVNRMMLGAMALRCLSEACGRTVNSQLVYDAPHNLVWTDGNHHVHRKGATPAEATPDPTFPDGHPVIVPGSMGDASYVLKGLGSLASLCSAPHGAGRRTARGTGRKAGMTELERLRIVTKIDLKTVRRDIADEYNKDLMEEAPSHYKPVMPVINTVADAGIASPVARLWPLLTIKA
jgi:tRNA-splicing ligase RtcB (3'-phosphate/5'-hydroxy nucleic acid ligase)